MPILTTTSNATPEPDVRGWAAAQLELKPDVTPQQVRTALLRQLPEDDFVLPYRCQQAALFLLRPADGAERILRQGQAPYDEEDRLRLEVDAFAAEFFELALPERRRRWQALRGHCAFCPPLAARLEGLERGLDVAPEKLAATEMRELAERVADLFVLRPAARALQRQELLRALATNGVRWQAAARQLQQHAPPVAALAPGLIEELASWEQRRQQQHNRAAGQRLQQHLGRPGLQSAARPPFSGAGRGSGWVVIIIVVIVINALRLALPGGSPSPKLAVPTYPLPTKLFGPRDKDDELWRRALPPRDEELQKKLRELQQKRDMDSFNLPPRDVPDPLPGPKPPSNE